MLQKKNGYLCRYECKKQVYGKGLRNSRVPGYDFIREIYFKDSGHGKKDNTVALTVEISEECLRQLPEECLMFKMLKTKRDGK